MGTSIRQQQDEREFREFKDKHGRFMHTQVEKKTGDPCQALRPVGWTAPTAPSWFKGMLEPPVDDLDIVQMVPKAKRARLGYDVDINYDRWLEKHDAATERWEKKLEDFARGLSKQMNPLELITNPTPELLKIVGPRPFPPREFIMAMKAGNEWALGLTDVIPKKAKALLDAMAPQFLSGAQRRQGGVNFDPFADDEEDDDLPASIRVPKARVVDPLNDDDDEDDTATGLTGSAVQEMIEEQFNPEALGRGKTTKPEEVEGGKGKGKKDPKNKKPEPAGAT